MLDHDDYMPSFVLMTEARRHDVKAARTINLPPGSIVAMDRAFRNGPVIVKLQSDYCRCRALPSCPWSTQGVADIM